MKANEETLICYKGGNRNGSREASRFADRKRGESSEHTRGQKRASNQLNLFVFLEYKIKTNKNRVNEKETKQNNNKCWVYHYLHRYLREYKVDIIFGPCLFLQIKQNCQMLHMSIVQQRTQITSINRLVWSLKLIIARGTSITHRHSGIVL